MHPSWLDRLCGLNRPEISAVKRFWTGSHASPAGPAFRVCNSAGSSDFLVPNDVAPVDDDGAAVADVDARESEARFHASRALKELEDHRVRYGPK